MSDRAKIRARRVTGNDAQQQREVAMAIKNAREMGLLPYNMRVTTQRKTRSNDDRGVETAPEATAQVEAIAETNGADMAEVES